MLPYFVGLLLLVREYNAVTHYARLRFIQALLGLVVETTELRVEILHRRRLLAAFKRRLVYVDLLPVVLLHFLHLLHGHISHRLKLVIVSNVFLKFFKNTLEFEGPVVSVSLIERAHELDAFLVVVVGDADLLVDVVLERELVLLVLHLLIYLVTGGSPWPVALDTEGAFG